MTPPTIPKRRRGAQPGNQNAPKHGFYARAYKAGELADLDAMLATGLQDEITMIRVATRRVIDYIADFTSPAEAVITLGALGLAATRLATLLRTQRILDGQQSTSTVLSQALAEVVRELGISA
jgi:hypothetical protein